MSCLKIETNFLITHSHTLELKIRFVTSHNHKTKPDSVRRKAKENTFVWTVETYHAVITAKLFELLLKWV